MKTSRKSGVLLALFLLFITTAYGLFQARVLIEGPTLHVFSPVAGETITSPLFEIQGETVNVTYVHINNRPVLLDTKGTFREKLVTPEGYGVVLIEAESRFGNSVQERIEFFGNPQLNTS